MGQSKIHLIYEEGRLTGVSFEELVYKIGKDETKYELINRAKNHIEEIKGIDFREYFKHSIIVKMPTENKVEEKTNKALEEEIVTNVKLHESSINHCVEDILTGRQIKVDHSEYKVGESLFATQDVGKKRTNQEDSLLIMEHSKNKDFKLLAVADGMGGAEAGEVVSRHIVAKLTEWFENLDPNIYTNMNLVENSLNQMLPNILNDLKNVPQSSGATLSCAIVGKNQTLITNIGDSRVYSMKDDKLTQETKDDSYVQQLYNNGNIPDKELMRFHKNNNFITQCISKTGAIRPNFKIIENTTYDKIIAVSDGVSDCISDAELKTLMQVSKKDSLTANIVNEALSSNSTLENAVNKLPSEKRQKIKSIEEYNSKVLGGKDNTSVAAYIKK